MSTSTQVRKGQDQLISNLALRNLIGVSGILLPILVFLADAWLNHAQNFQPSISDYYYANGLPSDLFVGILFALSFFLLSYRGYEKSDNRAATLAGFFALGVALLPCNETAYAIDKIHLLAAASMLLVFAYMSLIEFPKFTKGAAFSTLSLTNKFRKGIFILCGCIMLLALAACLYVVLTTTDVERKEMTIIYKLETICLWAFGLSWLVKGEFYRQSIQIIRPASTQLKQ